MKAIFVRIVSLLACVLSSTLASAAPVSPESYVFVPARGLPAEAAKAVLVDITQFVLAAATGSKVVVLDPVEPRLLASFALPPGTPNQRAHNRSVIEGITALKTALLESRPRVPWERGALSMPQTLRFLRAQVVGAGQSASVCFIGDPLHHSADPAFAFVSGAVPTSGWIFGSSEANPFAADGDLKGWRVHIAAVPAAWGLSDWQRGEIQNFWCSMLAEQGAALVSLADTKLALLRLASGASNALPFRAIDRNDRTRLWRRTDFIRDRLIETTVKSADEVLVAAPSPQPPTPPTPEPVAVAEPKKEPPLKSPPVVEPPQSAPEPEPTPVTPPVPVVVSDPSPSPVATDLIEKAKTILPQVGPDKCSLGIVWEAVAASSTKASGNGVDLDLHVRVIGKGGEKNSQWCSFQNRAVPSRKNPILELKSGDVTAAQGLDADRPSFELVSVNTPLAPEEIEAFVDVYSNRSHSPIRALLRFETNGKVFYSDVIEFPADSGDRGSNFEQRDSDSARRSWRRISLTDLVAKANAVNAPVAAVR